MNRYRNKFETKTGEWLDEHNIDYSYETERLPYTIQANYIPDFIVRTRTGHTIYIETKGNGRSFDGAARRKLIAVATAHPDRDLRLIFYSDGKIGPTRKDGTRLTQSMWADKHHFDYAIKEIPESWLE